MFSKYNKEEETESLEKSKELAMITSYIVSRDVLNGTIFSTFDKAWDMALNFYDKYAEVEWGVEVEWDETLDKFIKDNI